MRTLKGRRRSIGLTAGAIWLIAISMVFVVWSLIAIGTQTALLILIVSILLSVVFIAAGIRAIRGALKLPAGEAVQSPEEKKIWRRFIWVFGAEILAFSILNPIVGSAGKYELMPSLNLIIVGIHFFPLARIFRVPRYNVAGILFCSIPAVTLLAIPKQFEIGHTFAWYVVPSLGCGLTSIIIAAASLREAWNRL
jgi:hypothetical protein